MSAITRQTSMTSHEVPRQQGAASSSDAHADDAEWDAFLAEHPLSHHEQCSQYGRIRETYGFGCERVVLRRAGRIVGGVQILVQRTPIGSFALIKRGPLATNDDQGLMKELVQQIESHARRSRYVSLRVDTFPEHSASRAALMDTGFVESEAWSGRPRSIVNDLSQSRGEVLASMKKKARYCVRVAERARVCVESDAPRSVPDFHALHAMTAEHQGFPIFPQSYFDYLWDIFGRRRRLRVFVAYHGSKPLAAIINVIVGQRMIYGWGGIDRGDEARKLMANYLLHLTAMQWAREHGCLLYDFSGVTPFKTRFAGETIDWPLPMRKCYGFARSIRRTLLDASWRRPSLRSLVTKAAWRLRLRPDMPW